MGGGGTVGFLWQKDAGCFVFGWGCLRFGGFGRTVEAFCLIFLGRRDVGGFRVSGFGFRGLGVQGSGIFRGFMV